MYTHREYEVCFNLLIILVSFPRYRHLYFRLAIFNVEAIDVSSVQWHAIKQEIIRSLG
jgi:hypothetical protein